MSNNRPIIEEHNQELLKKIHQAKQETNEILQKQYSDDLIKNNESIIKNKVNCYISPSSPHFEDVLNDARLTVWRCIKNYDATKGTSFLTYIERTLEYEIKKSSFDLIIDGKLTKEEKCTVKKIYAKRNQYEQQGHTEASIYELLKTEFSPQALNLSQMLYHEFFADTPPAVSYDPYSQSAASEEDDTVSDNLFNKWEQISRLLTPEEIKILMLRHTLNTEQLKPLAFQKIAEKLDISRYRVQKIYLSAVQKIQEHYPESKLAPAILAKSSNKTEEKINQPFTLLHLAQYVKAVCQKDDIANIDDLDEKGTSSTFYKKIKRLYETIINSTADSPTFKDLHISVRERFFVLFGHMFTLLPFKSAYKMIHTFFKGKINLKQCTLDELQAYRLLVMWTLDTMTNDTDDIEMTQEKMFDRIDNVYYVLYTIKQVVFDMNELIGDLLTLDELKQRQFCEHFLSHIWTEKNALGLLRAEIKKYR